MNEERRKMEFDFTAGAFYVVGTLLLFGGLASGLAMAIAHFAQPGAAASAWTFVMLGGAALIVLGVAVAKRWRYAGLFLAVLALPIATQLPWGSFVVICIYAWLWKERKTLLPFEDKG